MRVVLNTRSGTLHRPECGVRGAATIWIWAADQSREMVATAAMKNGFTSCQQCRPFDITKRRSRR